MVFTSLPLYHLDPPNWSQSNQQLAGGELSHLTQSAPIASQSAPNPANTGSNSVGGGSRPGSMAERARLAKIPQPEPALKCPRCDSANTKFCYFNNYSLSQPRHFCKTCRRYWTRGGALRNVPVGGGCRRNKRSNKSSNNNKSSASSSAAASSSSSCSTATSGSAVLPSSSFAPAHHQLPFFSSLHPLADHYGSAAASLGLNFSSLHHPIDGGDFQPINGGGGSSGLGLDQWRIQQIQQFPFLGGLDSSSAAAQATGIYPNFDGEEGSGEGFHLPSKVSSTSGLITQLASVKMEDSHPQGLNLPRQYLGMPGNNQYLSGGGGWAAGDLSGFN